MKKKNNLKRFLSVLLVIAGAGVCFGIQHDAAKDNKARAYNPDVIIDHDTTWTKDDVLRFDSDVLIMNNATLTIEPGTEIEFIAKDGAGLLVFEGRVVANGTEKEKVKITASHPNSGSYIQFDNSPGMETSFFRYVEISNLGYLNSGGIMAENNFLISSAYAQEIIGTPALLFRGGKFHIENSTFINNSYSDIEAEVDLTREDDGDFLEVVNSNFENNDNNTAVSSKVYCDDSRDCSRRIRLKNNWYGDNNGPSGEIPNDITRGEIVKGDVFLDGWKNSKIVADPAIIIPGIMGSEKVFGKLKLDPILHTYDDLTQSFQENGYEKGKNLFEFPYDWRAGNEITASNLEEKIKEIIAQTKVSKVDLVAHSMGGLVARAYIEGNNYGENVDQLVTLGTPHKGAPESYLKWEAGEGFFGFQERFAKHHFKNEAKHNGYDDIYSYIQNKVASVRELLPDYDYLFDVSSGKMRQYAENYPVNTFLENLNAEENLGKLNKVNFINIAGNLAVEQATISKIRVVNSTKNGLWEHGMPENFYDKDKDINQGLERGEGDGTVPKLSSQALNPNASIEIDSSHGDLPTKAQCKVLHELANIEESGCQYVDTWDITNILLFNVFSPVDIQIVAPDGKRVGKNFATGELINEIGGAYYTGYDTDVEFVTIPNPIDGEYKIATQGTDNGNYAIEATEISKKYDSTEGVTESAAMLSGTANQGSFAEDNVMVQGDQVLVPHYKDTESPQISIETPEQGKEYLNSGILNLNYTVIDNISALENIKGEVFLDGYILNKNELDLSLLHLGEHVLKITATDEAGNKGEKEVTFKTVASFQSIKDNIIHYEDLGFIKGKNTKRKLLSIFREIEIMVKVLDRMEEKTNIPDKAKDRVVLIFKQNINHKIDKLINEVSKNEYEKKGYIDPSARELLVESLNFVRL